MLKEKYHTIKIIKYSQKPKKYEYIEKLIRDHKSKRRNNGLKIWSLIFFEAWYREYMEGSSK